MNYLTNEETNKALVKAGKLKKMNKTKEAKIEPVEQLEKEKPKEQMVLEDDISHMEEHIKEGKNIDLIFLRMYNEKKAKLKGLKEGIKIGEERKAEEILRIVKVMAKDILEADKEYPYSNQYIDDILGKLKKHLTATKGDEK